MFTLVLSDGSTLRGVLADAISIERLGALWGKQARISGIAKFRASGAPLRIEADAIDPTDATTREANLWSVLPKPIAGTLDLRELHQPQTRRSGVSAIFGRWPGDESEEEFLRAAAELS
jgi:hypothetical protein